MACRHETQVEVLILATKAAVLTNGQADQTKPLSNRNKSNTAVLDPLAVAPHEIEHGDVERVHPADNAGYFCHPRLTA